MNEQQLLETNVEQWNQWRHYHPKWRPNLSGINLSRCYLFEADLSDLNLRDADLSRACLIGANLSRADLSRANLMGAYLGEANLKAANLSWTQLLGASLNSADLRGASLLGAQIEQADFVGAKFQGNRIQGNRIQGNRIFPRPLSLGSLSLEPLSLEPVVAGGLGDRASSLNTPFSLLRYPCRYPYLSHQPYQPDCPEPTVGTLEPSFSYPLISLATHSVSRTARFVSQSVSQSVSLVAA
jgi:Pentapeptide repeats (8 copies)